MNLLSLLGLGTKQEPTRAYCQCCSKDITKEGGVVEEEKVYCPGLRCVATMIYDTFPVENTKREFHSPRKLQRAIINGKVTNYGQTKTF